MPLFALLAVILVLLIGWSQRSGDPMRIEVEGSFAYLNGTTDGRSEGAIRQLKRDHPHVKTLILQNMPGTRDIISNYRLARSIRETGLNTRLTDRSQIASGAVDLFLAGKSRISTCNAMIGVHAWGSTGFDAHDVGWDTHRTYSRDFLAEMGIDPDFYDFRTQSAGSETIHWMSVDEINRWGVTTEPLICD